MISSGGSMVTLRTSEKPNKTAKSEHVTTHHSPILALVHRHYRDPRPLPDSRIGVAGVCRLRFAGDAVSEPVHGLALGRQPDGDAPVGTGHPPRLTSDQS